MCGQLVFRQNDAFPLPGTIFKAAKQQLRFYYKCGEPSNEIAFEGFTKGGIKRRPG